MKLLLFLIFLLPLFLYSQPAAPACEKIEKTINYIHQDSVKSEVKKVEKQKKTKANWSEILTIIGSISIILSGIFGIIFVIGFFFYGIKIPNIMLISWGLTFVSILSFLLLWIRHKFRKK